MDPETKYILTAYFAGDALGLIASNFKHKYRRAEIEAIVNKNLFEFAEDYWNTPYKLEIRKEFELGTPYIQISRQFSLRMQFVDKLKRLWFDRTTVELRRSNGEVKKVENAFIRCTGCLGSYSTNLYDPGPCPYCKKRREKSE